MLNRKTITVALAGLLLSTAASAQTTRRRGADDPDQKEIYNYSITMDKIQKLGNATTEMVKFSKAHPELADKNDANPKSLDELVQKLQKHSEVVGILSKNSLTPREYALGFFAVMQAGMAVGFKKSGAMKEYPPEMLKLVSKQNLDFVEQHWDEIQKWQQRLSSASGDDENK